MFLHKTVLLGLALSSMLLSAMPSALPASFDRPLVVLVYDQTCHAWCGKVRPIVRELKEEYGDRVMFAELDATESVIGETKKEAKRLGVEKFLCDFVDLIPLVAVFNAKRGLTTELVGPKNKDDYKKYIERALTEK